MKHKLSMLMIFATTALALTGCGKFKCEACQEEKFGRSHDVTTFTGTFKVCDDCYKEMQEYLGN